MTVNDVILAVAHFKLQARGEDGIPHSIVANPSTPTEFSPIALLCFLSKVLEKLAHDQIVAYLKNSNILGPFQVSFRKHHCTQSALLH